MPLSPPIGRKPLVTRNISCAGFAREDGLFDVEGKIVDTRGYGQQSDWRGWIDAGGPIHEMYVRLTIDDEFMIRAVESATDAAPYQYCQGVTPNMQRLVGLKITGGFKKAMHERVGHTQGCTHIVTLIETLATVAIQTIAGHRKSSGQKGFFETFGTRGAGKPPLLNTCRTYSADSPVARELWPELTSGASGKPSEA